MDPARESGAIKRNGTPTLNAFRPPNKDTSGLNCAKVFRLINNKGNKRIRKNFLNMIKNLKRKNNLNNENKIKSILVLI